MQASEIYYYNITSARHMHTHAKEKGIDANYEMV